MRRYTQSFIRGTTIKSLQGWKISILLLLAAVLLSGVSYGQHAYNPQNGHLYEYVRIRGFLTWQQAADDAAERGGYLATVHSAQEATIIENLVGHPGQKAWLGGSDEQVEGLWNWVIDEPWDFTNWAPGQPDATAPEDDFLYADGDSDGQWYDGSEPLDGYIVEWNLPPDSLIKPRFWHEEEGGNGHLYGIMPFPMNLR